MIKEYKEITEDVLEILKIHNSISTEDLLKILEKRYNLSEKELNQKVACGRQTVFFNRVILARTYLVKQKRIVVTKERLIQKI